MERKTFCNLHSDAQIMKWAMLFPEHPPNVHCSSEHHNQLGSAQLKRKLKRKRIVNLTRKQAGLYYKQLLYEDRQCYLCPSYRGEFPSYREEK